MLVTASDEVSRAVAVGRARFPTVELPAAALASVVADRALTLTDLSDERLAEVYLAAACALGDPAALTELEREYVPQVRRHLRPRAKTEEMTDEVLQRLRLTALVAREGRLPEIASFGGAGALLSWLRIAALRIFLRLERQERRWISVEPARMPELAALDDPALASMRERYGDALQQALVDGFRSLEATEQVLLRLRYTDRCGVDQIARIEHVHRATAARRLLRAEEQLVREARRLLSERTGSSDGDLDSVLRLLRSQLALSAPAVFS